MGSLEDKATWQLHAFKNEATIINMQHLQQVAGQSRGSKQREKVAAPLGIVMRSVHCSGWQLGGESRLSPMLLKVPNYKQQ